LRRTARALGAVRDLDVALNDLRKHAQNRPVAEQPGLGEIRAVWRMERREAATRLRSWLDSPDYRRFIAGFARLCRSAGPDVSPSQRGRRRAHADRGRSRHAKRHSQSLRAGPRLRAASGFPEPIAIATLHALRIDCKALRYSLEPVEPLLCEEGRIIIGKLKHLQDLLGELNDAAVSDRRLAELTASSIPSRSRRTARSSRRCWPIAGRRHQRRFLLSSAQETRRTLAIAISKL
jgi:CHAD domain-containing protein